MEVCVLRRILAYVALVGAVAPVYAAAPVSDMQEIVRSAFANVESDVQRHWRFAEVSNDGEVETSCQL